jgi:biotin synthase-related radical SAM superfamily protein
MEKAGRGTGIGVSASALWNIAMGIKNLQAVAVTRRTRVCQPIKHPFPDQILHLPKTAGKNMETKSSPADREKGSY